MLCVTPAWGGGEVEGGKGVENKIFDNFFFFSLNNVYISQFKSKEMHFLLPDPPLCGSYT